LAAAAAILLASGARAETRLPIFDTHVHYSQSVWQAYPPKQIAELFDEAGVARALVSSTPDDGSLMLHRADPNRFVPELRPYRGAVTPNNWFNDPEVVGYLDERLKAGAGAYLGIGEFHLFDEKYVATPQVRHVVEMAVARGILLHVHAPAGPIRALFALNPKVRILWAHAGMSEPADVVGDMLDRYAALCTEVSYRASDIAPSGKLAPAWRAVLIKHHDRFMIGTDTHSATRWETYPDIVDDHRRWLMQLPKDVAEAIAWRNAARVFGAGGRQEFAGPRIAGSACVTPRS
jgi:predicted TIM-barrel fold metal-dependent hydrolase